MNIGKPSHLHKEDKKLCHKVAWVPPGTWQSVICLQYSGECKVSPYYKYVYEYWRRRRRCSMVDWELIFCPITPGSQITQILTQTARCMHILLLPNVSIWMCCVRESVERLRSNGQFISWAAFLSTVPMLALLWGLHCKCISLHCAHAHAHCSLLPASTLVDSLHCTHAGTALEPALQVHFSPLCLCTALLPAST